ncbi:MAG: 4Fe-4S ferredoxin [Thermoprotei archaeon]|nr:MAG: 4Fe-4S ferredoxin [Thermoprotei archaeon]RLE90332.1 MAG: 4Fe-4S ferredoxin [Thermoprotei archaeon]
MSTIYMIDFILKELKAEASPVNKLRKLLRTTGIEDVIEKGDYVAVKMHLGSRGGFRIIRPPFVREVVEEVKSLGAYPFITDTCRPPSLEYLEIANIEGINPLSVGAPVIIADGLRGNDFRTVSVNGEVIKEIEVASAIAEADSMIVLTHVKGHRMTGFGGAIKNVGMGCVSKKGKRRVHEKLGGEPPMWIEEKCDKCKACVKTCDHGAISMIGGVIEIDTEKCVKCYRCVWICPNRALVWSPIGIDRFIKALIEATAAVLSTFERNKVMFLNFVCDVTFACDCPPWSTNPIIPDRGILASRDIVAIDKASLDLIDKCEGIPGQIGPGKIRSIPKGISKFLEIHGIDPYLQVKYAEDLGLGNSKYELYKL